MSQRAVCVHCRADVMVPDSYAQGDHIKCGGCGTRHKVVRGETVRLVHADVAPLKEALQANHQQIARMTGDLQRARGSFGIGVNGLGLALAYFLYQVSAVDRPLETGLLVETAVVAVVSGILLELLNFLFLSKRKAISRLSADIRDAEEEGKELQKRIREAGRA